MCQFKFLVDRCLQILNTFPMTICLLKFNLWDESYGPEKFWLFYPIYPCILQVTYFSSCTFLHTQIQNLAQWLSYMDHNSSMDYSCAPNILLSKDLFPLEVNLFQNFTLTVLDVTFSYKLYFVPWIAHWITLFELFYLRCRDKVYISTTYSLGFWLAKNVI